MSNFARGPVAIGGVGGSGTRVMADLLMGMKIFVGRNLNRSNDNMSWPPFKNLVQDPDVGPEQKSQIARRYLQEFTAEMSRDFEAEQTEWAGWGWKVPTTYLHLDFLSHSFPKLRYIHLIRHGLDMVYSSNQNQLRNWGEHLGVDATGLPAAVASLRYWVTANRFAIQQCEVYLPNRFLLVRFEELCDEPESTIRRIARFIGIDMPAPELDGLGQLVHPPETVGRYRQHDLSVFSGADLEAVRELGFPV